MSNEYRYLFPYEKIPYGSKILIYGASDLGQNYLQQMLITHYCEVIGFIDKSYDKYPAMIIPVYPPEKIKQINFDYILLALKKEITAEDIKVSLIKQGIPDNKIIFQGSRNIEQSVILSETNNDINDDIKSNLAFKSTSLSIAFKYGSSFGSAIFRKVFFMEIARRALDAKIDIYSANGSKFISTLYSDQPQLNNVIDDGGILYNLNRDKYTIAMSVSYMVQVDYVNQEKLRCLNPELAEAIELHMKNHDKYGLKLYNATHTMLHLLRSVYRGWNAYTCYNYTDAFNVKDFKVNIPLMPQMEEKWKNMNLGEYITFNFGNGATSKGNKQATSKQWPKEYFEKFVLLFKQKFPEINIIQVGDASTDRIDKVDRYVLGESLELVKYILKGTLLHVDTESGLVHVATQLGKKCVVLFGPTEIKIFGYPQNINIISSKCKGCFGIYDNAHQCARYMDKPECMYSIMPEMVMEKVSDYLGSLEK